jgi:hypothetical protein
VLAAKGGFLTADPYRVRCADPSGTSGDGVWVKSLEAVRASAESHAKQWRGSGHHSQPPPPPQSAECKQLAAAVTERLAELQASARLPV